MNTFFRVSSVWATYFIERKGMTMKRTISLLLVLVILLSLCACGNDGTQSTDPDATSGQANTVKNEEPTNSSTENTPTSTEESTTTSSEESTDGTDSSTQTSTEESTTSTEMPLEKPNGPSTIKPDNSATTNPDNSSTTKPGETPTTKPTNCEHTYTVATCSMPKICTKCQEIGGNSLPHNYENGTCKVCGRAEMLVTFTEGDWVAHIVKAGTSEQGEILSQYIISKNRSYSNVVCYSNASSCVMNIGKVIYNQKTYYADYYPTTFFSVTWEENDNTITVTHSHKSGLEFVLTKIGETQLSVTSSNDTASIPVGTIFNKV